MAERSDGGTACGAHTRRAIAHAAGVVAGSWTAANEPKAGGTGNSALIGGRVGQQNAGHVAVRPQRVIQPTCRYRRREMAMSSGINRANLPKTLSWTRMPRNSAIRCSAVAIPGFRTSGAEFDA